MNVVLHCEMHVEHTCSHMLNMCETFPRILGLQLQMDSIHHRVFRERCCDHLVVHPDIANCFERLTEFTTYANDYGYDPFIRAKQFEKSTGIRLLRKG